MGRPSKAACMFTTFSFGACVGILHFLIYRFCSPAVRFSGKAMAHGFIHTNTLCASNLRCRVCRPHGIDLTAVCVVPDNYFSCVDLCQQEEPAPAKMVPLAQSPVVAYGILFVSEGPYEDTTTTRTRHERKYPHKWPSRPRPD